MSVDNPEISLIIPACNAEPYLEKCLDSVIRQSFFGWELIIVDDGSSDRTGEVAERYAAADSRIKVIHTSRQGVSAARNAGIDAAVGVFLAFADADDHLKPDYLKELLEHAKQNNADITQCSFVFEDEEGNTTPDPDRTEAVFRDRDEIMNAYLLTVNRPTHITNLPYWVIKVELKDLKNGDCGEGLYYMVKNNYMK